MKKGILLKEEVGFTPKATPKKSNQNGKVQNKETKKK